MDCLEKNHESYLCNVTFKENCKLPDSLDELIEIGDDF